MKKTVILSILVLLCSYGYSGIYRHDVPARLYKAYAGQDQFECVGEVRPAANTDGGGSCVLIGSKYVLSAAHVFIQSESVPDTELMIGNAKVTTYKQVNRRVGKGEDYHFIFKRKSYEGKRIEIMPLYLNDSTKGTCDLALIELDEPVEGVQPAVPGHDFDELHALVTGVGFGASGPASKPQEVNLFMEKIAGQNIVDSIGGYIYHGQPTIIMADFDLPFYDSLNKMGDKDPLLLEYCVGGGDSGGPLFRQDKNGWKVIGICAGGGIDMQHFLSSGYYGQVSEWTRVSAFYDWIQKAMNNSGKAIK